MGNPLKGILGSARKMGLDPMAMVANAVGQGNPMLGQLMKFATQVLSSIRLRVATVLKLLHAA